MWGSSYAIAALAALTLALGTQAQSNTNTSDEAAFRTICGACHAASSVNGLRTREEWEETVGHMVSLGAQGSDEQFDAVMRVLARTLTKVNVNTASASDIAPVLDVSEATAQSVVKYRAANGNFKGTDDLKKVPGLDAAKIDSRKDRLVF